MFRLYTWHGTPASYTWVVAEGEAASVPHYVVKARNARGGVTSRVTHIAESAFVGRGKQTLCGRWAGRYVNVVQPSEASCRQCRSEWQLGMAKEAAMTPEQRRARNKEQAQKQAAGCLLILLIILVVILFAIFHPHGGGAAQAILSKIPGCTKISTTDGNSYQDNTIAEGSCDLPNYASLKIYVWAAGDDLDQHDFVYWYNSCTPRAAAKLSDHVGGALPVLRYW